MLDCSGAWGANRQKVRSLNATGRWQELALLVMQVGYTNDLSYYYLGHAAENLGYWQAAQCYYRIAERLSVTQCPAPRERLISRPHSVCRQTSVIAILSLTPLSTPRGRGSTTRCALGAYS
jgi:hypothetical protein